jgi:hypothetical protein
MAISRNVILSRWVVKCTMEVKMNGDCHTQLMIYGMLKVILKEIISYHEDISELLCSYLLKTTLFWVIEETQRSIWDPKYIMLCFHLCLERLMQFIIDANSPNYFVPMKKVF